MCEPVTAITAAMAVLSYVDGRQQAKAQENAVREGYAVQQQMIGLQQEQVNQATVEAMSDRARAAAQEQARLIVIGGESGLGGLSNEQMLRSSFFAAGTDISRLEGNRERQMAQVAAEGRGAYATAQGRLNTIKQPSLIGAGLQIAGSYVGQRAEAQRIRNIGKIGTSSTTTTP